MSIDSTDVEKWSRVRFAKTETVFLKLVESVSRNPDLYKLGRSHSFPMNWFLCNAKTGLEIPLTHAFVVKTSTPLETGNFVPPGKPLPDGVHKDNRKETPQWGAQIAVTFDMSLDPEFHRHLSVLEGWAAANSVVDSEKRSRLSWMTPEYVADRSIYVATCALFQDRNTFNSKENAPDIKYPLHEWLKTAVVPHTSWVPNPARVMFYERIDGAQKDILKTDVPRLHAGDLVKMVFKLGFTLTKSSWVMALSPVQIIRVYRTAFPEVGIRQLASDNTKLGLKQEGDSLEILSDSGSDASESPAKQKGKGREVPSDETEHEMDGNSPAWDPITPLLEGQELPGDDPEVSSNGRVPGAESSDGKFGGNRAAIDRVNKRERSKGELSEETDRKKRAKSRGIK